MLPFIFIHSIYFISFCSDHSVIVILTIEDKTVIALTYINCSANNLKCECSLETRSCLVVDTLSVDKNLDVEEGGGSYVGKTFDAITAGPGCKRQCDLAPECGSHDQQTQFNTFFFHYELPSRWKVISTFDSQNDLQSGRKKQAL